jgi:hypothetical protein
MYESNIADMQDVLRAHTLESMQSRARAQQEQQKQSQMDPAQAYQMYQKFQGARAAPTSAGQAPAFQATTPGIAAGPEATITSSAAAPAAAAPAAAAPAAAAPAAASAAPASGASAGAGAFSFWPAALVAAIVGTSVGLDKKNVSSFKSQLKGDTPTDLLNSPSVKKILPDSVIDAVRPWADMHGVKGFKDLPKDVIKSMGAPVKDIKKLFGKIFG